MSGPLPIAVTCGEPAGIGPEIAARASAQLGAELPFFVIGDPRHFAGHGQRVIEITAPSEASAAAAQGLAVLPLAFSSPARPGKPDPGHAGSIIAAIKQGVDMVQAGAAGALTTLPIHKKALQDGAGFPHPGHTEFLAHLAGRDRAVMLLASDLLHVVPATIHIPLADVPRALTPQLLRETIEITAAAFTRDFGIAAPRLAVAGLNPHAGEGGAMGREEIEIIAPLIRELRAGGLAVTGPHSADTLFHAGARAGYDVAIAMYHDQALIPLKTLDFAGGVNVTLGLPFVRTSPDHGTAFDIAGTGRADPTSLIAALRLAGKMAAHRAQHVAA